MRHKYFVPSNMAPLTDIWATSITIVNQFTFTLRWRWKHTFLLVIGICRNPKAWLNLCRAIDWSLHDCVYLTVLMEARNYVLRRLHIIARFIYSLTLICVLSYDWFWPNFFCFHISSHIAATLSDQSLPMIVELGTLRCIRFVIAKNLNTGSHLRLIRLWVDIFLINYRGHKVVLI